MLRGVQNCLIRTVISLIYFENCRTILCQLLMGSIHLCSNTAYCCFFISHTHTQSYKCFHHFLSVIQGVQVTDNVFPVVLTFGFILYFPSYASLISEHFHAHKCSRKVLKILFNTNMMNVYEFLKALNVPLYNHKYKK